ncbi:flagellar basal-body rod modification protein FlgD [Geosporobacter subterraneus DSM 17957]|uniref:Flagellar basal-body rod modification protein FlgD n=1 Tax=Geosporobacter subterraneus DSM 17957 TaxID=1121919 RepID=A0A1M6E495_9FIRM|nr:flagellar hook capping FlgD N-terminal domain-containing protein [Geosporobacter subterraneus]SHI80317.1 flagellar basal-body rod modification protein FlgD [Geosporobacter subterraneus DSM 17957]
MSSASVNHVSNTGGVNNRNNNDPNQKLDKDAFLKLLVTQLRHQDPLNPVEDKEFIAQMAQFSTLEQVQNLNKTMTETQELIEELGVSLSYQMHVNNSDLLSTNKEILKELVNLNKAIKEYGLPASTQIPTANQDVDSQDDANVEA